MKTAKEKPKTPGWAIQRLMREDTQAKSRIRKKKLAHKNPAAPKAKPEPEKLSRKELNRLKRAFPNIAKAGREKAHPKTGIRTEQIAVLILRLLRVERGVKRVALYKQVEAAGKKTFPPVDFELVASGGNVRWKAKAAGAISGLKRCGLAFEVAGQIFRKP